MGWWRSNIQSSINRGRPPRVPVLIALSYFAQKYPRSVVMHRLRNLINARENDLKWRQVPTLDQLESYAHNTQSIILYTLLSAMMESQEQLQQEEQLQGSSTGGTNSTHHMDHVTSSLGKAFGMIQVLRAHRCMHRCLRRTYRQSCVQSLECQSWTFTLVSIRHSFSFPFWRLVSSGSFLSCCLTPAPHCFLRLHTTFPHSCN